MSKNSTTSAILRYSVHFTIYMYLYIYSYRRETARHSCACMRIAQLTRCFSAVAELIVPFAGFSVSRCTSAYTEYNGGVLQRKGSGDGLDPRTRQVNYGWAVQSKC